MNKIDYDKLITDMWTKYPCHITYHEYTKNVQVINITQYQQLKTKDYFNILSTFSDADAQQTSLTFIKFYVLMLKVKQQFLQYLEQEIKFNQPRKLRIALGNK